jgi:hypothetical protein
VWWEGTGGVGGGRDDETGRRGDEEKGARGEAHEGEGEKGGEKEEEKRETRSFRLAPKVENVYHLVYTFCTRCGFPP